MAQFSCNDIDAFCVSMEEFAAMPNNIRDDIIEAGARVVKKAHEEKIRSEFTQRTGKLAGSVKISMKTGGPGGRYALIYPQGQHHTYNAKKHGKGVAYNNDVAFVQEFGGHGNAAHQWMQVANEGCAEEVVVAEEDVYYGWIKSLGL